MKYQIILTLMAAVSLGLYAMPCSADDSCITININYHERVPYAETKGGKVVGLTATAAATAFEKASVSAEWKKLPSKRQLKMIEKNVGCDCAIGWFKNPDREKFAKYTLPIYQDKPQIALARTDNRNIWSGQTVDSVLSNPKLSLGIKDGYSYGSFLDAKIALNKPVIDKTIAANTNMLKKIHAGRSDYFFIAPEEADSLIKSSGLPIHDFKYINSVICRMAKNGTFCVLKKSVIRTLTD